MTKVTLQYLQALGHTITWKFEVYCVIVDGLYLWDCPAVTISVTNFFSYRTRDWGTEGTARALEIDKLEEE